jgi:hypothetical protein
LPELGGEVECLVARLGHCGELCALASELAFECDARVL